MGESESHGKSEKQHEYRESLVLKENQQELDWGFHTPPRSGSLSKRVGKRPTSSMLLAATSPAGPAPIIATIFLPIIGSISPSWFQVWHADTGLICLNSTDERNNNGSVLQRKCTRQVNNLRQMIPMNITSGMGYFLVIIHFTWWDLNEVHPKESRFSYPWILPQRLLHAIYKPALPCFLSPLLLSCSQPTKCPTNTDGTTTMKNSSMMKGSTDVWHTDVCLTQMASINSVTKHAELKYITCQSIHHNECIQQHISAWIRVRPTDI